MSLLDTLKGLVGKGQEAAAKNSDKITGAVDKAGDFIDQKTKGKYSDKIEKGKDAAKKAVPTESGPQSESGQQPPASDPKPESGDQPGPQS